MLALLSLLFPGYRGWRKLHTSEGVRLLFPLSPARKTSESNTPLGPIQLTVYSARSKKTSFSAILSIRDFTASSEISPNDMIRSWRAEYDQNMQQAGVDTHLNQEEFLPGEYPRCNLLYSDKTETVFTRISLLTSRGRLVALFAVGRLHEITDDACIECFRSIRL